MKRGDALTYVLLAIGTIGSVIMASGGRWIPIVATFVIVGALAIVTRDPPEKKELSDQEKMEEMLKTIQSESRQGLQGVSREDVLDLYNRGAITEDYARQLLDTIEALEYSAEAAAVALRAIEWDQDRRTP